jgi:hypothetical protein
MNRSKIPPVEPDQILDQGLNPKFPDYLLKREELERKGVHFPTDFSLRSKFHCGEFSLLGSNG